MTPAQCRAARGLLDWSQLKLAEASRIAVATVIRFERNGRPVVAEAAVQSIQRALEAAGIKFIDGDEPGVKLKANGKRALASF
jgi:transcriptional regulator with XRE-family HTH domain